MNIVVGSTALRFFDCNRLPPSDLDIWTSDKDYIKQEGEDVCYIPEDIIQQVPAYAHYATADAIYTIKCSHFGWDIHWQKTKLDIMWLKGCGCKLIPDLYKTLVEFWKVEHHDKSFLSLKKDKDTFFTDHVTYVYDHDYLHELVAYPNRPMYESCLKEGEDVLIDQEKFNELCHEDKVRMFREEITTIAIERWLVNPHFKGKYSWFRAYMFSLHKTVTRLTKGWATDFIVLNIEDFVKPKYDYFKHAIKTLGLKL